MQARVVNSRDLEIICRHREQMFREAGREEKALAPMTATFRNWLRPRLLDQTYFGFFLVNNEDVIAGIGLMEIDWPPHPAHPLQDKRGYVLNVYVEPDHRRQGLGKRLMDMAEAEFSKRGLQFSVLHATQIGRPLYEKIGWQATTEMTKTLS